MQYGNQFELFAISPFARTEQERKGGVVGVYTKHGLVGIGQRGQTHFSPCIFSIFPSGSAGQPQVRYGDVVILVDQHGLVWNNKATNQWTGGYLAPRSRSQGVSGECHVTFFAEGRQGQPVRFNDGDVAIDIVTSHRKTLTYNRRITNFKKDNSHLSGGYLCCDGSGKPITFTLNIPQKDVLRALPELLSTQESSPPFPNPTSPRSPRGGRGSSGTGEDVGDGLSAGGSSGGGSIFHTAHISTILPTDLSSSSSSTSTSSTTSTSSSMAAATTKLRPSIRYHDVIRLWAMSTYANTGGYVGVYEKHQLACLGPDQDFYRASDFVIKHVIKPKPGDDITREVQYGEPVMLVDRNSLVWNNNTGFVNAGYIALRAQAKSRSDAEGQLALVFQPADHNLNGAPVHMYDKGVSLDIAGDNSSRKGYDRRITNFKRKNSMIGGGYLVCDGSGRNLTFTIHPGDTAVLLEDSNETGGININNSSHPRTTTTTTTTTSSSSSYHPPPPYSMATSSSSSSSSSSSLPAPSYKEINDEVVGEEHEEGGGEGGVEGGGGGEKGKGMRKLRLGKGVHVQDVGLGMGLALCSLSAILLLWIHGRGSWSVGEGVLGFALQLCAVFLLTHLWTKHAQQQHHKSSSSSSSSSSSKLVKKQESHEKINTEKEKEKDEEKKEDDNSVGKEKEKEKEKERERGEEEKLLTQRRRSSRSAQRKSDQFDAPLLSSASMGDGGSSRPASSSSSSSSAGSSGSVGSNRASASLSAGELRDIAAKCPGQYLMAEEAPDVPVRYVRAEKGNIPGARARWAKTSKWRKENRVDDMMERAHCKFEDVKELTVQYFHKHDRQGNSVYIEMPKRTQIKELEKRGINVATLLYHYVYITEYLWKEIDPNDMSRSFSILDMEGVGYSDFVGNVMDFVKKVSLVTKLHYPERSAQIIIVNAPWTFNAIWRIVKSFLDPATVSKTHVFGSIKEAQPVLHKYIDPANLPRRYGGTCKCAPPSKNNTDDNSPLSSSTATTTSTTTTTTTSSSSSSSHHHSSHHSHHHHNDVSMGGGDDEEKEDPDEEDGFSCCMRFSPDEVAMRHKVLSANAQWKKDGCPPIPTTVEPGDGK